MIVLVILILILYFLIMTIIAACRRDPEKALTFLVVAAYLFIAYNSSMNLSSSENKNSQFEWLVSVGLYHF